MQELGVDATEAVVAATLEAARVPPIGEADECGRSTLRALRATCRSLRAATDAVVGSSAYDLMSLLEDARRDIDPHMAARLIQSYLAAFPDSAQHF